MSVRDIPRSFIFPRIPLDLLLPESYPDLGKISNISVIPEIKETKFHSAELEIAGDYQVAVSYFNDVTQTETDYSTAHEMKCEDFFSHLKVHANGLLGETEENVEMKVAPKQSELYTVHFIRPFHTYIDYEQLDRPRYFRPGIAVEDVNFEKTGARSLKGHLTLGLINRTRRGRW